jgi:putative nucleotidyltransferase with HDIG domain
MGDDGNPILYPFWGRNSRAFMTVSPVFSRVALVDRVVGFAGALSLSAASFALILLAKGEGISAPPLVIAGLALVALFAEKQSVYISGNTEMSVSVLPVLFAAVLYGPLEAMIVGACALLGEFSRPYTRWIIWTSARALTAGLAGVAAAGFMDQSRSFGVLLIAVLIAALVESLGDIALNSLTIAVRRSGSFRETARALARLSLSTVPLYAPVIGVLIYSYRELSPWTVLLFFVPAIAAQRLLLMYHEQRELASNLAQANQRLEKAGLSFASALVAALDARDRYTAGHSAAVAVYARDIARRLGLSEEDQQLVHLAGLVHDIGKVGLPAGLLEKPGPLTLEERRVMEEHSAIGERILRNVDDYQEIATIVRHHHERIDGNGYPDGLIGADIPLISRILAVADAYNAMTSGRPYRDAMPSRVARLRLAQAVESQFDTTVVAAFEAILAGANESYLSGLSHDFAVEAQRHSAVFALELAASSA